jgi:hypothetical protein
MEKGDRVENKIYNVSPPFDIPPRLLILIYIFLRNQARSGKYRAEHEGKFRKQKKRQ